MDWQAVNSETVAAASFDEYEMGGAVGKLSLLTHAGGVLDYDYVDYTVFSDMTSGRFEWPAPRVRERDNSVPSADFRWWPVEVSTNVRAVGWQPYWDLYSPPWQADRVYLGRLWFWTLKGRVYRHEDVPRGLFSGMLRSESKGEYHWKLIRDKYDYKEVVRGV